MRDIRVASVQFEHESGNKSANLLTVKRFVEEAAHRQVEMIVFPECCITGYWFLRNLSRDELTSLAEPIFNGPSSRALMALAKEFNMTVGAGLVEIGEDQNLYNTYVVTMPDGSLQRHRKAAEVGRKIPLTITE